MKNQIWIIIFVASLAGWSCQKDDLVTGTKPSVQAATTSAPAPPLFSTFTSFGRNAYAISAYSNGGYVIAGGGGHPASQPGSQAILLKVDERGEVLWHKNYCDGFFRSIIHTRDNHYIVSGPQLSVYVIMKVDPNGKIIWSKKIPGGGTNSVIETADGDYVAAGAILVSKPSERGQGWAIKLSKEGEVRWQKTYRHVGRASFSSVVEAPDGSYVAAGIASLNLWMVNISKNGDVVWEREYGGSQDEGAESVIRGVDGGYVLAGHTRSKDGDVTSSFGSQDLWIVKTDDQGNKIWQKSLGGSGTDYAYAIIADGNSGYVLAGNSSSTNGSFANIGGSCIPTGLIVKVDIKGNMVWAQMYKPDHLYFVTKSPDGIFITGGRTHTEEGLSGINLLGIAVPE